MDEKTTIRAGGERWRDRAEEMLNIAGTMQNPEAKAQMERLAADWFWLAEQEEQQQRQTPT
jgi:hypothetical protein